MMELNVPLYFILMGNMREYLIELDMLKSNILDVYSNKYTKIKINSDDDLPLGKTLNVQNVVILVNLLLI